MANSKEQFGRQCNVCKNTIIIEARPEDIQAWQNGKKIQNALPYLNVNERELLMSGVCGTCFDKMMGGWEE